MPRPLRRWSLCRQTGMTMWAGPITTVRLPVSSRSPCALREVRKKPVLSMIFGPGTVDQNGGRGVAEFHPPGNGAEH